jgi:hypothetical protein
MRDKLESIPSSFGSVDLDAEHGVLHIDQSSGVCRLTLLARTERGFPRRELAVIPIEVWNHISATVKNELLRGMDPAELAETVSPPTLRSGHNAVSPLIARELAVLLWSLMEDEERTHTDSLLAGWRQLAREERWWLYARASNPSQREGHGWRRALFFALTDPADTRTSPRLLDIIEAASVQKKKTSGAKQNGASHNQNSNRERPQAEKANGVKKRPSSKTSRSRSVPTTVSIKTKSARRSHKALR